MVAVAQARTSDPLTQGRAQTTTGAQARILSSRPVGRIHPGVHPPRARSLRGQCANLAGLAAEDAVLRAYRDGGCWLLARRWRGLSGEIDMILARGDVIIFVEVKRAATHGRAAEMLRPQQMRRVLSAAAEYLDEVLGNPVAEREVHLATVDGVGRIEVIKDAFMIF